MKVVHRDLKSANVFIDGTLSDQMFKIGDFNVSKVIDNSNVSDVRLQ